MPEARQSRLFGTSGWRHPRSALQAWWHNRLPRRDTLTLTQRNVYILPTRAGWMLALTLVLLLVASINYQLNLGYLLTFLLAGSAVVGMHVCHGNLRGLTLNLHPPEPVHASQPVDLQVQAFTPDRTQALPVVVSSVSWSTQAAPCERPQALLPAATMTAHARQSGQIAAIEKEPTAKPQERKQDRRIPAQNNSRRQSRGQRSHCSAGIAKVQLERRTDIKQTCQALHHTVGFIGRQLITDA